LVADELGGGHVFAWFKYQNPLDAGFPGLNCEGQTGQSATHNDEINLQLVHTPTIALTSPSGKSVRGD
jgi:hypothetical protein